MWRITPGTYILPPSSLVTAEVSRRFTSNAIWPDSVRLGNHDNSSHDAHDTREAAEAVCRGLERDGYGGEGKIFPLKTWVGED